MGNGEVGLEPDRRSEFGDGLLQLDFNLLKLSLLVLEHLHRGLGVDGCIPRRRRVA